MRDSRCPVLRGAWFAVVRSAVSPIASIIPTAKCSISLGFALQVRNGLRSLWVLWREKSYAAQSNSQLARVLQGPKAGTGLAIARVACVTHATRAAREARIGRALRAGATRPRHAREGNLDLFFPLGGKTIHSFYLSLDNVQWLIKLLSFCSVKKINNFMDLLLTTLGNGLSSWGRLGG